MTAIEAALLEQQRIAIFLSEPIAAGNTLVQIPHKKRSRKKSKRAMKQKTDTIMTPFYG